MDGDVVDTAEARQCRGLPPAGGRTSSGAGLDLHVCHVTDLTRTDHATRFHEAPVIAGLKVHPELDARGQRTHRPRAERRLTTAREACRRERVCRALGSRHHLIGMQAVGSGDRGSRQRRDERAWRRSRSPTSRLRACRRMRPPSPDFWLRLRQADCSRLRSSREPSPDRRYFPGRQCPISEPCVSLLGRVDVGNRCCGFIILEDARKLGRDASPPQRARLGGYRLNARRSERSPFRDPTKNLLRRMSSVPSACASGRSASTFAPLLQRHPDEIATCGTQPGRPPVEVSDRAASNASRRSRYARLQVVDVARSIPPWRRTRPPPAS